MKASIDIKFDNSLQANTAMQLALGRIFKLLSRPFAEGDIEQYENAKYVFIESAEYIGMELKPAYSDFKAGWNFGNSKLD